MKMEKELKKIYKWLSNTLLWVLIKVIKMPILVWGCCIKMEEELKKIITNANNVFKLVQIKEIRMLNIVLKIIVSKNR